MQYNYITEKKGGARVNYTEIGKKLKSRRKALNLTQSALAEKVDLTESSISRYEAGRISTMPTSTVKRICEVLHIEPSELLGLTPENSFEYDLKEILKMADDLPDYVTTNLLQLLKQQIKVYRRLYYDKTKDNNIFEEIKDR
jgi:transcriptional regulator with XRE-family HTH domain